MISQRLYSSVFDWPLPNTISGRHYSTDRHTKTPPHPPQIPSSVALWLSVGIWLHETTNIGARKVLVGWPLLEFGVRIKKASTGQHRTNTFVVYDSALQDMWTRRVVCTCYICPKVPKMVLIIRRDQDRKLPERMCVLTRMRTILSAAGIKQHFRTNNILSMLARSGREMKINVGPLFFFMSSLLPISQGW